MRILHVSQGLPPFRVGGLTRYCMDVMNEQKRQGDQVALLYPGSYAFGKTRIKKERHADFEIYKIINPLPLALIFGINSPGRYMEKCNSSCYEAFLQKNKFDLIHVHCTMGVHKEFFEAAKAMKIPMMLTTHDFYLLCPKCTFWNTKDCVCMERGSRSCSSCNQGIGLSRKMEILMQSKLYEKLKYAAVIKNLRKRIRKNVSKINKEAVKITGPASGEKEYEALLAYNEEILEQMDMIHCNSSFTREIYEKYKPSLNYKTLPITHGDLPGKTAKERKNAKCRIGYFGGIRREKGFQLLLEALEGLEKEQICDWELYLYGADYTEVLMGKSDRYINKGFFSKEEEEKVYHGLDVVVVPSLLYETFSFIVLEALAAGKRVICSDTVGARDLLADKSLIFSSGSVAALKECLKKVCMSQEQISEGRETELQTLEEHVRKLRSYCSRL